VESDFPVEVVVVNGTTMVPPTSATTTTVAAAPMSFYERLKAKQSMLEAEKSTNQVAIDARTSTLENDTSERDMRNFSRDSASNIRKRQKLQVPVDPSTNENMASNNAPQEPANNSSNALKKSTTATTSSSSSMSRSVVTSSSSRSSSISNKNKHSNSNSSIQPALLRSCSVPTNTVTSTSSSSSSSSSSSTTTSRREGRYAGKTMERLPTLQDHQSWEIVLLIDKRERSNALIQGSMVARNIPCQMATLAVGDFLWVARRVGGPSISTSTAADSSSSAVANTRPITSYYTSTGSGNIALNKTAIPINTEVMILDDCEEDSQLSIATVTTTSERTNLATISATTSITTSSNNNATTSSIKSSTTTTASTTCTTTTATQQRQSKAAATKAAKAAAAEEIIYVLDCIAERKTIPDLASSIVDGRYLEQKSRLQAADVRSTLYIIEGEHIVLSAQQKAITAQHIKTCMASIVVDFGMNVLRTRGMDHTISCLQHLHRQVEKRFERRNPETATYQPFQQFQTMYGKKAAATNRQLFGHMLRQISGCSVPTALALMNEYGTTARFIQELRKLGADRAQHVIANMIKDGTSQRIGPALAKKLVKIFCEQY